MLILLLLIPGFMPFAAVAQTPSWHGCGDSGNYTLKSTYRANLELLSAELPKNASSTPIFYAKGSVGAVPDTVYGLALCRGDVTNASVCGECVATGFQDAQQLCAFNKDAAVFYDPCILRFSDQNFIGDTSSAGDPLLVLLNTQNITEPMFPGWDPGNAASATIITDIIKSLVQQTAKMAAYNSTRRYATGIMDISSSFPRLYSMTQCTPDMASPDCWACLKGISDLATEYFTGRQGGRILGVRCNFRYEMSSFYQGGPMLRVGWRGPAVPTTTNTTAPPPTLAAVPSQKHQKRVSNALVITATVVSLLVSFFLFIFCFGWIKRRGKGKASLQDKVNMNMPEDAFIAGLEGSSSEFTFFDFSQVTDATSNFSDENKLGEGGFGPVYKGQLPDDGLEIAIKRLSSHSGQGFAEFKNEVQLIAKLQHTNLVRLLGCCTQGEEKILIYEYLPNGSLDFFIFDETQRALLNWNKRLAIIEGIAQGILYLHKHSRLRVIHRDLKASNILLDCEMNPKISDFGLAKIFSSKDIEGNTKRVVGTYGYMAPEYASEGIFSMKSDVFSYGVLILEVISGKRNSGFHQYGCFFNLLGYAWTLWNEERSLELVDTSIVSENHALEMIRCVNIALLCVQENAADRPSMSDVVAMLSSCNMTLPEPKHPAYFHIRITKEESSKEADPSVVNDVTISVLHGR